MAFYLGVDGGGSSTSFVLIDDDGGVRARATAPSSYYFAKGFDVVERTLRHGMAEIERLSGIAAGDVDAAFFGIPGYGEASADVSRLAGVLAAVLGHDRYGLDNDMVCGWAGSLGGADGINVIAGTGSMAYGQRAGTACRVGGWGELFGDEGSAYWIARRGLNAFSRMSDGRATAGVLHALLRERLALGGDLDAVSLVIDTWGGDRSAIAALATTVCTAADRGDPTAAGILRAAVGELVGLLETTRHRLGFPTGHVVPVSYSGGMFADHGFRSLFADAVAGAGAVFELRPPLLDPATGAALYAAARSGRPLRPQARHRLVRAPAGETAHGPVGSTPLDETA